MKAKKLVALIMSGAMLVGTAAMFAACNNDDEGGTVTPPTDPVDPVDPVDPSDFVEDTNTYYAVGASNGEQGTLYNQGWNATSDTIKFTKDTTVTNENKYTLQLTMYAGDAFKILCDTTKGWSGEQVNQYSLAENEYFKKDIENIELSVGYDGIYTFTLITHPEKNMGKYELSVVQDETIAKLRVPYDMQVLGDFSRNATKMVKGSGTWTVDFDIQAKHLIRNATGAKVEEGGAYAAVYIYNAGDGVNDEDSKVFYDTNTALKNGSIISDGETITANLLEAGHYTVTFTEQDGSVVIKKITDKWHFVLGDAVNAEDSGYDLIYSGDTGLWTGSVTLTAETTLKLKNLGDDTADEVTIGTLAAGPWVVKYDPIKKEVKYESRNSYYLTGSLYGWGEGPVNGTAVKLTATSEEGVYETDVDWTDKTGTIQIKVIKANFLNGVVDGGWYGAVDGQEKDNDGNLLCQPGKYHITFTTNGNVITVTPITE